MYSGEFATCDPMPRNGLTSIEAVRFLKSERPDVPRWTCWAPESAILRGLAALGSADRGTIGEWHWEREPCTYPAVSYLRYWREERKLRINWTGLLRVTGPAGENFLLFSCLTSMGQVGSWYLASTEDRGVLERFFKAACDALSAKHPGMARVRVLNGPDLYLTEGSTERIFLPQVMQEDIEQQVLSFYASKDRYKKLGIPYRRGLLFVGVPGCGKTMMIRRLVRECHRRFNISFWALNVTARTDEDDVCSLFYRAAQAAPGMIILEDLDSLAKETRITRSSLLAHLDGLVPQQGLLVIATTNNPQDVDPALLHRPSRFDRVWLFDLPDHALRKAYLQWTLPGFAADLIEEVAGRTGDWTFAYLNELRATAAILCIRDSAPAIEDRHIQQAFKLLSEQFQSGRKHHPLRPCGTGVGFGAT